MIISKIENYILEITLSRPKVKNALNAELISKLSNLLQDNQSNSKVRVVVIQGSNGVFSSGADLKWLENISHFSYQENYSDSREFVKLINTINYYPKPIISKVEGAAIGGGSGIALASDIILATPDSFFGISEVAIGIIPAAIIHLVNLRLGETKAREYLLTGERIPAIEALKYGMINYCIPITELDIKLNQITSRIVNNGPNAVTKVKEMQRSVSSMKKNDLSEYISETIAQLRSSAEAKEGIKAFLSKRKPNWTN
ncbi:enoyl-CoA hydratase-related protein [Candidatus Kapabacteria bacterium]|nr:enoyl-CoA hydratase-related protein [Candidatus Kapabacteria bacterium]